jgi:hypothetical protein
VYEDVHWSDPTTRESLDLLVDHLSGRRTLVIMTFRPEFVPPWLGRPHVTMLTLNRLSPRQRTEMIGYVTGGTALPREIAEQIVDRTDGVPVFIEELTKSVVESGIISETGDSYAVTGPATPLATAPRHRVSAAKRTPSGETAWGPEVLQFRLCGRAAGCRGDGEPPGQPKLGDSTAHAPRRQLRLCIARTICSYHSRLDGRCNSPRCLM